MTSHADEIANLRAALTTIRMWAWQNHDTCLGPDARQAWRDIEEEAERGLKTQRASAQFDSLYAVPGNPPTKPGAYWLRAVRENGERCGWSIVATYEHGGALWVPGDQDSGPELVTAFWSQTHTTEWSGPIAEPSLPSS